jgi:hypothetical protein
MARSASGSFDAEILSAIQGGPDSLNTAVRNARLRIEAALPPGARSEFRAWMQEHHEQLMHRMHGAQMHHDIDHEEESMGTRRRNPATGGAGSGVDTTVPDVR